jgi:replication factor A1
VHYGRIEIPDGLFIFWMRKNKEELCELVKDIKSREEFEKEIKEVIKNFNDLIDEDAAAFLLVDKLGRNKQHIYGITDLKPDMECTIFGKIKKIYPVKTFEREDNRTGRVVNLDIADNTGTCRLVLWDDDVELVVNNTIQVGSIVKVINGYTKLGRNNVLEVNVGKWGAIEVEPEDAPDIILEEGRDLIEEIIGEIVEIEQTKAFFKDNGDFGFVTNIRIKDLNKNEIRLTLWDEKVKEIQRFEVGDRIVIKGVDVRYRNSKKEFHVSSNSKIIKN